MRPTAKARPIHRNDEAEDDSDDSPTGHTPVPPATGSATSSGDGKAAPKTSPPAKGPPVKAKAAVPTPSFKASGPPVPDPANAPHSHFFPPLGGSWPYSLLGAGGGGVHVYFPPYVATPALHHVAAYEYSLTLVAKAIPPKSMPPRSRPHHSVVPPRFSPCAGLATGMDQPKTAKPLAPLRVQHHLVIWQLKVDYLRVVPPANPAIAVVPLSETLTDDFPFHAVFNVADNRFDPKVPLLVVDPVLKSWKRNQGVEYPKGLVLRIG
ncbi:hypothetical protein AK812_SmicGene37643 [Symbiodinium microadriaticum]|uniref:Uncharacterized protein n=1 Tax=Symbiodinium microadriaticum TaxID=2951 RepID=A0A1Q9CFS8_SYMMI|nr:hypothetical protein AK812_SmicGene37643 [Symbiodinium microadriaticum]